MSDARELHHVAIAVSSIDEAIPFYRDVLGLEAGEATELTDQRVRVVFLTGPGARVELVEPLDGTSGVARFVAARGRATLHHICFTVDALAETLRRLETAGVELIDRAPRTGAEGDVAFIHPRASDGVLIELIDRATIGR